MIRSSNDWHSEGRRLQDLGKIEKAAHAYQEALKLEETRLDSINNLGVLMRQMGLMEEAEKLLQRGLGLASIQWSKCNDYEVKNQIAIHWARLLNSKSILKLEESRYEECRELIKQQLKLEPNGCGYVNLGVALDGLGRHCEAARSHMLSLRRHKLVWNKPEELIGKSLDSPTASSQLHRELCNLATSRLHDKALSVQNWKLLLSRLGVTEQNWTMEVSPWERLWGGEACNNLLIWDEQGFGDALQCLRWIDACTTRTQKLTLMLRPELLNLVMNRLALSNNCNTVALPSSGPPLNKHERHCPLMGLPVALADEQGHIPTPKAPKGQWLQRSRRPFGKKFIGLVWAAGRKDSEDAQRASKRRSIPATTLLKHALSWRKKCNVELISLQLDAEDAISTETVGRGAIQQLKKGGDWESTAKVVERLDLLVSVDTAMVHLAGNLGVPCLLLLNRVHDWRWGTVDAPQGWYPEQTVLRCKRHDDWERLLQEADSWVETWHNG